MRGRGRGSRSAQPPPQRPPGPEPIFPALPLTFQTPCAQRMLAHGQGQRLTLSSRVRLPLAGGRAAAGSRGRRPWAEAAAQGPLHASPSMRTGPSQWPASKEASARPGEAPQAPTPCPRCCRARTGRPKLGSPQRGRCVCQRPEPRNATAGRPAGRGWEREGSGSKRGPAAGDSSRRTESLWGSAELRRVHRLVLWGFGCGPGASPV